MSKQLIPEKECPECKGKIDWKVVYGNFGRSQYNGLCRNCKGILRDREIPDVTKGRKLAKDLKGVHPMDKRITRYNGNVQIGILRELQK